MPNLTPAERNKLVGILGRLGSDFDGERAAAALLASRLLAGKGLAWDDVIPTASASRQAGRGDSPNEPKPRSTWQANLALCRRHLFKLDDWPARFITSISRQRKALTPAQAAKLAEIADELRAQGLA